ncbi:hypothetical protein Y023_4753 [Burkholderia pseudomallei A79D]|nr:hypothetical protein Y023_4753 [Burkholderia pseudomallei A79D]KGX98190.1 hypothetical protein X997_4510 [Burkholderia pseudomallei A79C]
MTRGGSAAGARRPSSFTMVQVTLAVPGARIAPGPMARSARCAARRFIHLIFRQPDRTTCPL